MDRKQASLKMYHAHRLFLQKLISRQLMDSRLSEFETRELFALEMLGAKPWISMSELSSFLNTAANTMTGIVNRMVRRKLVQRRNSEKDRRVVEIALTESGELIYQEYLSLHLEYVEGLMQVLTDQETEQYLALMEKMVSQLESLEGDS